MLDPKGTWLGRVWRDDIGPCLVTLRDGHLIDITSKSAPTCRDIMEMTDPAGYVSSAEGVDLGPFDPATPLLAPCDLQAVKAAGVTFARSMVERVIEERAGGDPMKADAIRVRVKEAIGDSLANIVPGSPEAEAVKAALIDEGMWSQYLEVGIGPYAEVFTKCQPMAAVGQNADIGLHPDSAWNNPEPEIVLAVNSRGEITAATIGNDVNLRDFEGRSALLLSKAKDNNASTAIGPMFRLFDANYTLDDMRAAELTLTVTGQDGFVLNGHSSMKEISRDPVDIVGQSIGAHHQYADGFVLFLGTLFAPTEDRDVAGEGFTHKIGDTVSIAADGLGELNNTVRYSNDCAPWEFGASSLMRNLAGRGLL